MPAIAIKNTSLELWVLGSSPELDTQAFELHSDFSRPAQDFQSLKTAAILILDAIS